MTVQELITRLQQLPPDLPVLVENGLDPSDLETVGTIEVSQENTFYDQYGWHYKHPCVTILP